MIAPPSTPRSQDTTILHSTLPEMNRYEKPETHDLLLKESKIGLRQHASNIEILKKLNLKIRVMTWNLLFNLNDQKCLEDNKWPKRLPKIVRLIEYHSPDILGTQELYGVQKNDLHEKLKSIYEVYGKAGPGKSHEEKETNAIFFKKERFICRQKITREMRIDLKEGKKSEFPDKTFTFLRLYDTVSKNELVVLNTHLTFDSPDIRDSQVRMIVKFAHEFIQKYPVLIMGDFNFMPLKTDISAINPLPCHDGDQLVRLFLEAEFRRAVTWSLLGHAGTNSTYTNNPPRSKPFEGTGTPGVELDEIFVNRKITVLFLIVETAKIDGQYPSDHLPKEADILLNP